MMINRENIEQHIFDYLEGNLDAVQVSELKDFISQNPEYKAELDYWKQSYVSDNSPVSSYEFSGLKKRSNAIWYGSGAALLVVGFFTYIALNEEPVQKVETEEVSNKTELPVQSETKAGEIFIESSSESVQPKSTKKSSVMEVYAANDIKTEIFEEIDLEYIGPRDVQENMQYIVIERDLKELSDNMVVPNLQSSNEENQDEKKKKKNKEVKVIKLNSTGF